MLAALALPAGASAQPPSTPIYSELSRSTAETPGQKVTYIEIEPPAPSPRLPQPPPAPPTAAQQAEAERLAGKRSAMLMLSINVYPGYPVISELRWWHEGHEWKAYANLDARIASHVGRVESASTVYGVIAAVGAAEPGDLGRPVALRFPTGEKAVWLADATEAEIAANPEAFDGVEAWVAHYNSHRPQLVLEHARLEFEAAARERERLSTPPKPAELVIRYWKTPAAKPSSTDKTSTTTTTQR